MDTGNDLEFTGEKRLFTELMDMNERIADQGLALTAADVKILIEDRRRVLRENERIEFKDAILPKLIQAFSDSPYIDRENFRDTVAELQEIFFFYKNESRDIVGDDELIVFMKKEFNGPAGGSIEYLEGTSLEWYAQRSCDGYAPGEDDRHDI